MQLFQNNSAKEMRTNAIHTVASAVSLIPNDLAAGHLLPRVLEGITRTLFETLALGRLAFAVNSIELDHTRVLICPA